MLAHSQRPYLGRLRSRLCEFFALLALSAPTWSSATNYYVNPSGNDNNSGSVEAPWKTFYHAAQILQAGDTAIFANGTYVETRQVVVTHSGTSSSPITFESQNKLGAVIYFQNLQATWGHLYTRQSYITIENFDITENAKGTNADDVLVYFDNATGTLSGPASTGNKFIGNTVHGAYFNTLKAYKTDYLVVDGNSFFDTDGLAFVSTNSFGTIFRNNYIYDVTAADPQSGTAIQFKGGVRSAQIYDNVFRVRAGHQTNGAIAVGGQSSANAVFDSSANGYEAYNSVAYNNVIVAEDVGSLQYGLLMSGAKNSALLNNIVIGAVWAIYLEKAQGDIANGWAWEPTVASPIIKNNMILNSYGTGSHTSTYLGGASDIQGTVAHDYNLYFNAAGNDTLSPPEPHGVYANPLLIDDLSDWHAEAGSPALGAGQAQVFRGYLGEIIDVSVDAESVQRSPTGPWSIGIYQQSAAGATPNPPADVRVE